MYKLKENLFNYKGKEFFNHYFVRGRSSLNNMHYLFKKEKHVKDQRRKYKLNKR
jgi:hypothetical protein